MKQLFMCGKNTVLDAIRNKIKINCIYVSPNFSHTTEILNSVSCRVVSKEKQFLDALTNNDNHQGIVAELTDFPIYPLESMNKHRSETILVLDHIQDVHNFGAIIRTANIFGIDTIIFPKDRAADINSTVLKISSGGFLGIKFIKVSNIATALRKLKDWSYWIYSTTLSEKSQSISNVKFNKPAVIVVGNEEKGISKAVEKESDCLIHIPQFGSVQSLNVSVATGIVLYEATRKI